jgi:hypothetical protein
MLVGAKKKCIEASMNNGALKKSSNGQWTVAQMTHDVWKK